MEMLEIEDLGRATVVRQVSILLYAATVGVTLNRSNVWLAFDTKRCHGKHTQELDAANKVCHDLLMNVPACRLDNTYSSREKR